MLKLYAAPSGPDRRLFIFAADTLEHARIVSKEARLMPIEEVSACLAHKMQIPTAEKRSIPFALPEDFIAIRGLGLIVPTI